LISVGITKHESIESTKKLKKKNVKRE